MVRGELPGEERGRVGPRGRRPPCSVSVLLRRARRSRPAITGFTLIELLVVIAITAILATVRENVTKF